MGNGLGQKELEVDQSKKIIPSGAKARRFFADFPVRAKTRTLHAKARTLQ
jgi:hypothetical protein